MVVVGGGFGGATAAKYIRLWDPSIEVVLVERNARLRLVPDLEPGARRLQDDGRHHHGYDGLARHGVQVVRDEATAIDADRKQVVRLARGGDARLRPR